MRFVQVLQDGFEGYRGALREVGAALFGPGVDGGFGGDADGFGELDAREAVGCDELSEGLVGGVVGLVDGVVGGCHGASSFARIS